MSNVTTETVRGPRRLVAAGLALAVGVLSLLTTAVVTAPAATAADETLSHVASASSQGNRSNHTVRIPASVQAGDALVLFLTWNSVKTATGPAGWTQIETRAGNAITGRAWTKVATGADANANVTATTSGSSKSVMSVAAYRSTGGMAEVAASEIGGSNTNGTSHVAPAVSVAEANSWLVSAWAEKSAATQNWNLPAGATSRTSGASTGSGKVSQVVADSNGAVATGTAAARPRPPAPRPTGR